MAYKQNPARGQSDSYASMLSKGLINEPKKKRTHVEKDGVIHKIIGDNHIKSPSGKIIQVKPNEWKDLYRHTDYTSKGNLKNLATDYSVSIDKVKDMKKDAPKHITPVQQNMITHQANEMKKIFDAQND